MPQVEVTFDIDANGIINVSAKDLGTGNEQQISIEGGSGLAEDEVEQMIKDAEAHADEAHQLRELADAKNQAESLAYATEKSLKEHREKLDESDASTIEGRVMELKQALESRRPRRDPRQDRRAPGGLAEAGRGGLRPGPRSRRRRAGNGEAPQLRRRGDRGRRRGRRRGGQDLVMTEPRTTRQDEARSAERASSRALERRARRVPGRPQAASRPSSTTTASGSRATRRAWSRGPTSGS